MHTRQMWKYSLCSNLHFVNLKERLLLSLHFLLKFSPTLCNMALYKLLVFRIYAALKCMCVLFIVYKSYNMSFLANWKLQFWPQFDADSIMWPGMWYANIESSVYIFSCVPVCQLILWLVVVSTTMKVSSRWVKLPWIMFAFHICPLW